MTAAVPVTRPALALAQATVLHVWTHIYHVALLPLYLPMAGDLGLPNVGDAALLVSLMMGAYFLPSYGMGILADRLGRKPILALGLAVNALGFIALSRAHSFRDAAGSVIIAGLGGSAFHPAATAWVARLYPLRPGRAFGWFGIGASLGFFLGPLYSGWRALAVGWRQAVWELGVGGILTAAAFASFASEPAAPPGSRRGTRRMDASPIEPSAPVRLPWALLAVLALVFAFRDFGGAGNGTVSSLYLQNVQGDSIRDAGIVLSLVFVASAVSNPLFGHWSERQRLRWAAILLPLSGVCLAALPWVPRAWFPAVLMTFGFFFMSTYPMIEASLMQAVPDAIRGRVFGLFITIGGLIGNVSHWAMGHWVGALGSRGTEAPAYRLLFGVLAACVAGSIVALPLLRRLSRSMNPTAALSPP